MFEYKSPLAVIAAGALAAGMAFYKSVQMANDWNKVMAEINVTAQKTPAKLKAISVELLKTGSRNTNPIEDVPIAFNTLLSATDDVDKSLAALEPTLKSAMAGFTGAGTAAKAATAIMGSTGISATEAYLAILSAILNSR